MGIFGRKKDTSGAGTEPGTDAGSGRYFCFIVSGNPSLIGNIYEMVNGIGLDVGHFQAGKEDLRMASEEAKSQGLQFAGSSYLGEKDSPAEDLGDIISNIAIQGTSTISIACAPATPAVLETVKKFYNAILSDAVSQMILPFPMFVTQNLEAAQFLLDHFTEVQSSFAGKRLGEI